MKASIIIPAYNEEKCLGDTVQAALAQDYPDFEIIVVNNASKDNTEAVARGFESKHPNKIKVVNENRKGLLWARECGRMNARGDIIVNIDADCLPEKDWLSKGLSYFKKENVVAVSGPYDYYDGDRIFRYGSLFTQKIIYKIASVFLQLPFIKKGAVLIGGNTFIRAEVLKKAGGYDTSIVFYGEDTDTAKMVSRYGKVLFKPSLTMKTSARRFKNEGTLNIFGKYLYHFFKTIFSKKKN